jgi:hypothetical protein
MVHKRSKTTSMSIGRDAKTGRFISVKKAKRRPATTVVATVRRSKRSKKR